MKKLRYLPLLILFIFTGCQSQSPFSSEEIDRWEQQASEIEILRDDFGVPHIYGKTDADAVFGLMYAQAEDDFKRVERNYIWAIGRLAEVEGEDELYSDLRARLFMSKEEAIAYYDKAPQWLKELCDAWAAGLNYYLHTNSDVEPELLNRFQRLDGSIAPNFDDNEPSLLVGLASGRWGALASYGSWTYDTKKLYGTSGNSFVAVVEFGDTVKAKSLLAGGQSGDPDSPHFFDQAERYVNVNFKDVAYYREDVEARAEERYNPGER